MRILIADDQPKVRRALRVALARQPGSKSVGEATDTVDLLAQARSGCPDLILLDWDLQGIALPDLMRELRRSCERIKIIVLSERPEVGRAALDRGADAFVSKADPPECLMATINEYWTRT